MSKWKKPPGYHSWSAMKDRVLNPKNERWHRYGGRGIKMDPAWLSFERFIRDMGPRPSLRHSIERRNNDGNYEPSNCYWATPREQQNNMRQNVRLEFNGKVQTVAQWSRETGLKTVTIRTRLRRGWPVEDVFNSDVTHTRKRPCRPRVKNICTVPDCGRLCAHDLCARHLHARWAGRPLIAEILPRGAKIRPEDVLTIRTAVTAGERHRTLAERFGVSSATISDISRRRSWRNI